MAKRKVAKAELPPKEKAVIVIDRFMTWCNECIEVIKREDKVCPHCGKTFTHVTTSCPLEWMPSTVKSIRPDLIFVKKEEL
jgi:hypothetical protein